MDLIAMFTHQKKKLLIMDALEEGIEGIDLLILQVIIWAPGARNLASYSEATHENAWNY